MPAERVIIVGAGPAGFAAARSYREHGGTGSVTLLGEEPVLPYQRPALTKELLRGELEPADLELESAEWFEKNRVELHLSSTATAVSPQEGTVSVKGMPPLRADAVVLATGAEPVRPDLPGFDDPAVMSVRTLTDSLALAERVAPGTCVLVLGSGFIGCELAASLSMGGATVSLIGAEPLPQSERLGRVAGVRIADWIAEAGIELIAGTPIRGLRDARTVELEDGSRVAGDLVVLGLGARPRIQLARAARLPERDGAVLTDTSMECRAPGAMRVLAAGDVACAHNPSAGRHLRVEHWGDALAQGEVAGRTLAGVPASWDGVPGFWTTIGRRTLKYAAWGDGYDDCTIDEEADGAFVVWYSRRGRTVGVLAHERDEDYERGRGLIAAGGPP